jgi:hypothetical protein
MTPPTSREQITGVLLFEKIKTHLANPTITTKRILKEALISASNQEGDRLLGYDNAYINHTNEFGENALILAVKGGDLWLVQQLLETDIHKNKIDNSNSTALDHALILNVDEENEDKWDEIQEELERASLSTPGRFSSPRYCLTEDELKGEGETKDSGGINRKSRKIKPRKRKPRKRKTCKRKPRKRKTCKRKPRKRKTCKRKPRKRTYRCRTHQSTHI